MKKLLFVLIFSVLLLSGCQRGPKMPSYDDLLETIAELEEENSSLHDELDSRPDSIHEDSADNSELESLLYHIEDDMITLFGFFEDSSYTFEEASAAFDHMNSLISAYY